MGWQTGNFGASEPLSWTDEQTLLESGVEEPAMDELLDNLDRELDTESAPAFRALDRPLDTSCWDLSDRDATPAPERWHDSMRDPGQRAATEPDRDRADTQPDFDERRTAVWSPSPELRAHASKLIGHPMAAPTPPGLTVPRTRTAEGTRPPSQPVLEPGKLVFPAETPRAILPVPERNHQHGFAPVRLERGRELVPAAEGLARGSLIPMSARSLQIDQGRPKSPPPPTAMLRLEPRRPGLFARLAAWLRGLFGKRV